MNTTHGQSGPVSDSSGQGHRFLLHALLAAGGAYLLVKLWRGMGQLFWTLFGLAFAMYWMFNGHWW